MLSPVPFFSEKGVIGLVSAITAFPPQLSLAYISPPTVELLQNKNLPGKEKYIKVY